ncbi:putative polysaccharide biosynthesis protein [Ornithinibacillus xuwenensis]|uniref:Polysaccharide biosynthesis protein n=1 Tax=Ornithinibacillus xuwenensis TaxID=3144668 RepID=A0ABU9XGE3_9BACI
MSQSSFVKSTIILTIATLISKILGSIFRIPLQNIAGDEVLGIFSLVYPVYMVALILSVAGLPLAISKLIAEARSKNDTLSIRDIYRTASILAILFGLISFLLLFTFSTEIAGLLGGPSIRPALIVVSATLLFAPYMAIYRGFFQGFNDMRPTAVSQVIEQFIRASLIIAIAYYMVSHHFSNTEIAGGIMVGSIIGVIGSLLYLWMKYRSAPFKASHTKRYTTKHFRTWSKRILAVSIPIAIGSITMALFNVVDSITVSYGLRSTGVTDSEVHYLYGVYSRGLILVQIATVFATSVVLPLVPLITAKLSQKDYQGTRSIMERTHEMTSMISWPIAIVLFVLAAPLNLALFMNLEGSWVLAIIGFSSIFTCLTLIGTGILQGINLAKLAAIIIIGGVLFKTFSNIILIHLYGLEGAAISTLLVYLLVVILNTVLIIRKMHFSFLNRNSAKIILASIVMGAIIGIPTFLIDFEAWNRGSALLYVFLASIIGGTAYFVQLYWFKIMDKTMLKRIPLIQKVFK